MCQRHLRAALAPQLAPRKQLQLAERERDRRAQRTVRLCRRTPHLCTTMDAYLELPRAAPEDVGMSSERLERCRDAAHVVRSSRWDGSIGRCGGSIIFRF